MLINERLKSPTEMLIYTTKLFKLQKERFEEIQQVVYKGLLKFDNEITRSTLIPQPKACLAQLEKIVPDVIKKRTDEARRWLS